MRLATSMTALALLATCGPWLAAEEAQTALENLDHPCGVAVQPETGHVFVSESGAGRVIRVVAGRAEDVVVGFGKEPSGDDAAFSIGPLGLAFLNQQTLAVGGGDLPAGQDLLRVFAVPAPGSPPVRCDAAVASRGLSATDTAPGEGNFFSLAASPRALFVTCHGDDKKGWIGRVLIRDGQPVSFDRFIATTEATGRTAPGAVAISPRGEVVVGQTGKRDTTRDAMLTFYNANDGNPLLNLETGLYDISALTYGPDGQLYATDPAWKTPEAGGLYRLVSTITAGKQAVQAQKVHSLARPTAMAFAPDGSLYVTVLGPTQPASSPRRGKLLKIAFPKPAQ